MDDNQHKARAAIGHRRLASLSIVWLLTLSPASGHAASFDCAKAATPTEKAICSDPALSVLDEQLADAYAKALRFASSPKALRVEQKNWLTGVRDRCGVDTDCLGRGYEQRVQDLLLRSPTTNHDDTEHTHYRLLDGEHEPVCQVALRRYNDDTKTSGAEQYSWPEFSRIHWREIPFVESLGATNPKVAILDLYNDNGNEAVITYRNSGLGGPVLTRPFDGYRIGRHIDEWSAPSAAPLSAEELFGKTTPLGPNELYFRYGGEIQRLFGPEIAEPFIYRGVIYIGVQELPRTSPRSGMQLPGERALFVLKYLHDIDGYNKPLAKKGMTREQLLTLQRQYFMIVCVLMPD